ncbi:glycolate oxidase FAD binding subunit [Stella humosa]|uniref:Glycolate oxidase FAD binding subunit n=1 Tax=Stella humosa TaxID=94 RepID=A0A3N1KK94_9PROT|nr:glycolate oxidase subunit GlcE [Stella humosa]ROP80854.1 glycolate oxidase FAD binding subunit [Stella humosa]BBK33353.1 2-hydroxy-acid oxidase [Stella humosa]
MILTPDDPARLAEMVAGALADGAPLELVGAGTKRGLGRPMQAATTLDLSGLTGVTLYEPEELVMSARAGTKLAAIEAELAARGQMLAFEPPDHGPLYGGPAGAQTIGGVIATNLAGPRRIKAGAARDHFLGFEAVSGRGEAFKSGGRVVKNVTGYDLCKLVAGSHGTLAALHLVTFKVLPVPEKTRTVLLFGADAVAATAAMAAALGSPHEVASAAHLPAAVAARSTVDFVRAAGVSVTAVRVEGPEPSVAVRCAALRELLGARGAVEELHSMRSARLWAEIRDVASLLPDAGAALWRLSVAPMDGPGVAAAIARDLACETLFDWGGGLVWLATAATGDAGARTVRAAVDAVGGHATLLRAPEAVRAVVPPFHPQPAGLAALARRVKDQFDPRRILNPGRMAADL